MLGREAGQKMEIRRPVPEEQGEPCEDFWQPLAVPHRRGAIHRGRDDVKAVRMVRTSCVENLAKLTKNGIDALGHGLGTIGLAEEVGEAGHDADTRLRTDLGKHVLEDPNVATGKDLRRLHGGVRTETRLVDVTLDIRVAKQSEDTRLDHHDEEDLPGRLDQLQ